jgi:hypothetical protein
MPKSGTLASAWWGTGFLLGGLLFIPGNVTAQNVDETVKVFLDCNRCDESYIRTELAFVDYVRDPQQADVHVFITSSFTVLSGRQYELSFIGLGSRAGSELNLTRVLSQDASNEETRAVINEALRLGLAPFLGYLDAADEFSLVYREGARPEADEILGSDPWRHWVFNLYGGDFELDRESNRTVFDSRWGFYADHRSEDWKIRFRPYFNYDLVRIQREGRPNVRRSITRHGLDSYVIRSLGPHWSVGFFADYVTRDDRNLRHWLSLIPGVEYSVLPYDVATRRAITIVYRMGINYTDYFERTIFNKTREWLPRHELDAVVMIRRPWGDIYSGLEGAQYLNDLSKQRAEIFANFSVRLFEGFSFEFEGSFEMIRDQLSLPLGELSLEDILLQQRELATDYYMSVGLGFSYTFGSEFANVVNTRF